MSVQTVTLSSDHLRMMMTGDAQRDFGRDLPRCAVHALIHDAAFNNAPDEDLSALAHDPQVRAWCRALLDTPSAPTDVTL